MNGMAALNAGNQPYALSTTTANPTTARCQKKLQVLTGRSLVMQRWYRSDRGNTLAGNLNGDHTVRE